jgi:hypothetical protein
MSNSTTMPEPDKQEWASVESKAKDALASVREMAGHATSAVGAMASRAACDVSKEADQLTANAGVCMEHLGEKIGKNAPHTGVLGNASQSIAGSVREGGEYLQSAKLGGMAEDVAHLIRRNPIPAVLIAIGLGWFVSRTIRS